MRYVLFLALVAGVIGVMPESLAKPYIAHYKHDKTAAFSFTFDDGRKTEAKEALSVIDPLGIKGTFFIMPLSMKNKPKSFLTWNDVKTIHANGHEIGTHASVGVKLHEVDKAKVESIIIGGHEMIVENAGIDPISFAMPGKSKMTPMVESVIRQKHTYIRNPSDFKEAKVGGMGSNTFKKRPWNPVKYKERIKKSLAEKKWHVVTVHAITKGYANFGTVKAFRDIVTHIQQQDFWIAPMGTVSTYLSGYHASQLVIETTSKGKTVFSVKAPVETLPKLSESLTVVFPDVTSAAAKAMLKDGTALGVVTGKTGAMVDVPVGSEGVTLTW